MATAYLLPVKTAALLFPLLALALLVPVAISLYRRHGVMGRWRALSVFGFLYYLFTALCMTIVPLPRASVDVCREYADVAHAQLMPGNTFADIWKEAHHQITPGALVLHNPAVWGTLFNIALLLPLGVFLRYHFRRGLPTTAAIGLGTSLFYELTQYTGLWGVYPCPYRLADIDDLAANTAGAVLGWLLIGPLVRKLPPLDALDDEALARHPVPFGRRLLALLVDLTGLTCATGVGALACSVLGMTEEVLWSPVAVYLLWYVALPRLTGTTPGKRLLLLNLAGPDGGRPETGPLLVRALIIAVPLLPLITLAFAMVFLAAELLPHLLGSPGVFLDSARQTDAKGLASELLTALADPTVITSSTTLGALLTLGYALALRRHPRRTGLHETISGVRNHALPGKRVTRQTSTVTARRPRVPRSGTQAAPVVVPAPRRAEEAVESAEAPRDPAVLTPGSRTGPPTP